MTHERHFHRHGQAHRFLVTLGVAGWDIREEVDSTILHEQHVEDWHRVERAILVFDQTAVALERDGWSETTRAVDGAEHRDCRIGTLASSVS